MHITISITYLATALFSVSSLVNALPQLQSSAAGSLQERQATSPDGTCGIKESGAGKGYRCPGTGSTCCSQWGWCGSTEGHCGAGCQSGYGSCTGVTPPPTSTVRPPTTTATPTPSPTGTGRSRPGPVPYGVQLSECTVPGVVALTFDDGPYAYTPALLNLLARHGVKATFFVNGQNWGGPITTDSTLQSTLRNAYSSGHQIASHTWSHPDLATLSAADIRYQMLTLETALKNIIGVYPTYMRPPYFSCSGTCFQVMNELSYHVIYANIDPRDWQYNTPSTTWMSQDIYNNAISSVPAANGRWIVLNHDVHAQTVQTLAEYEILRAKALGYRLVTVGECFNDPPANWYRR